MKDALDGHVGTVSIGNMKLNNLRFTNDIDRLACSERASTTSGQNRKNLEGPWNGNQWRDDEINVEQLQQDH